jgi:2-phospho-L-lactate guanylyltransferase
MGISAFIPVKKFSDSKARLKSILHPKEREQLASKMAKKSINALKDSNIFDSITLVTNDPDLHIEGTESFLSDSPLNKCLDEAIQFSKPQDIIFIMHADLPTINMLDLQKFKSSFNNDVINIVSDTQEKGTNCLMFHSSMGFDLKFGIDSYQLFLDEFSSNNYAYQNIKIAALKDDLDSEEDYFKLIKYVKG